VRTNKKIVDEEVAHRDARSQRAFEKLSSTYLTLSVELSFVRERE
jgi:hypothetical protein